MFIPCQSCLFYFSPNVSPFIWYLSRLSMLGRLYSISLTFSTFLRTLVCLYRISLVFLTFLRKLVHSYDISLVWTFLQIVVRSYLLYYRCLINRSRLVRNSLYSISLIFSTYHSTLVRCISLIFSTFLGTFVRLYTYQSNRFNVSPYLSSFTVLV